MLPFHTETGEDGYSGSVFDLNQDGWAEGFTQRFYTNTQGTFKELMKEYRAELQDNDCGTWSKEAREWAISNGLINGTGTEVNGEPNYAWADQLTREQAAALFYRFAKLMGKA